MASHPSESSAREDTAPPRLSLAARVLLTAVAVPTSVGPFIADWNATHLYNPRWPPHAKFHNAQTMLLGLALGACALLFTWRAGGDVRLRFRAAALFAGLYWVAQLGSIAFPGTAFVDPDNPSTGLLFGVPAQVVISAVLLALLGAAGALQRRHVARGSGT